MKFNLFLALIALAFFACSSDSPDSPDVHGAADIDSQLYVAPARELCNELDEACIINVWNTPSPYTGNGVLKNFVREYNEDDELVLKDISNVGTVTNGKVNLELHTPTYLTDGNMHSFFELMLYDNSDKPVGRLMLHSFNNLDDNSIAYYVYSKESVEDKYTYDLFPNQNVIFVYDIEFTEGWNILYENDRYSIINGERTLTLTRTTDPGILNGGQLRWYLSDQDEL